MYMAWIPALMMALLVAVLGQPTSRGEPVTVGAASAIAAAMGEYHTAAEHYLAANPGASGAIPAAALDLSPNYVARRDISARVEDGILATWYAAAAVPPAMVAGALADQTGSEAGVGVARGGIVVSRRGSYLSLPTAVPAGAAVKATKVQ